MTTEMSTPYNWCDARCERCMLVRRCDVAQWPGPDHDPLTAGQLEPSQWGEEEPEASDDRLASDAPSRQAAEARDQLDDPPKRPERSLAQSHWYQTGLEYAVAVKNVIDSLGDGAPSALRQACEDARSAASLVACKCARISSYLTCDGSLEDSRASAADAVPNLLLLERSLADAAIAIVLLSKVADVSALNRFWLVHQELDQLLVANREVREAAWIAVRALIESGDAPSPFAVARDPDR